jgi:UDP-N-acetylmuramoyl-tripeptide--D-alanyl-D-alanine ligase
MILQRGVSVLARYKWQQIPGMIKHKNGRRRIRNSIYYRLKFLIIPIAVFYRTTIIRHVKVIAVVGSFGKTTTTRTIAAAIGISPEKYRGTNNGVFVATELLRIPPWAKYSVLEVGISEKGQMAESARLVKPDIVVVTCIGSEHGTSLGGLDNTREEKAQMVRALPKDGLAVLNGDDEHVQKMRAYTKARVITHGYADTNDLQAKYITTDLADGTKYLIKEGEKSYEILTPLYGRAAIRSILAALAVTRELGIDEKLAVKRMSSLSPAIERNELLKVPIGAYILADSFKSAIETVKLAFETFEDLPAERKLVILGEVEEPPGSLGVIYREIGADLARIASHLIFIGSKRVKRPLFNGAKQAGMSGDNLIFVGSSITKAICEATKLVQPGDLVLIKGRSSQKLIRIAYSLNGDTVLCNREFCTHRFRCIHCDQLAKNPDNNPFKKEVYRHNETGFY